MNINHDEPIVQEVLGEESGTAVVLTTNNATFIHREIFHLKPKKVNTFRACLAGEYSTNSSTTTTSSDNALQQQRSAMNEFDDWVNNLRRRYRRGRTRTGGNRRRNDNGTNRNGSIIQSVRQMNGCYSFDIYCRFDNPLKEIAELAHLQHQNDDKKLKALSLSSSSSSSPATAAAGADANADASTVHDRPPTSSVAVAASASTDDTASSKKDETKKNDDDDNSGSLPGNEQELPHQFMVMGRWENRNAHEAFFLDGSVQNFFCPLISHKVIESLPILTMWKRENGVHHRMHSNNNEEEEESSKTLGHFVVTRRHTLKDSSNLDRALVVVKELGCAALKATGCSVYEVCTTGHPDFNQGEILEVGIWDAWTSFLSFASQSLWRDCNESLDGFFAEKQHELTCWIRPTDQFFAQDGDK